MSESIKIPTVGTILKEEFIEAFEINQNILAEAINVPAGRISEIINNKRTITADTDLRLTRYFGLSEGYFLRLQENIELRKTKIEIIDEINKIVPIANRTAAKTNCNSNRSKHRKIKSKAVRAKTIKETLKLKQA